MPSNVQKLLADYHDASKRLEKKNNEDFALVPDKQAEYHELCTVARELVSRCLIADKPRGLCFLILELSYLAKVIGSENAADHLFAACEHLNDFFHENGAITP